jgi:hypothetical protein
MVGYFKQGLPKSFQKLKDQFNSYPKEVVEQAKRLSGIPKEVLKQ